MLSSLQALFIHASDRSFPRPLTPILCQALGGRVRGVGIDLPISLPELRV